MIKIEGADKSFESCQDCVHAYDSTEICILRRCIHAFSELRECYKPKKELKPSAEPEPCEDVVSRQAVYNVLDKMPVRGFKKDGETIHGLISLSQVNSAIINLPSAQPETHDKHTETHACDLISRQAAIDALKRKMVSIPTAGEKDLMGDVNRIRAEDISVIRRLPSAQPEPLDEWCTDCKEYDHERHCCPRWNRVIRTTLKDMKEEQPEPKWIPCSERLPEERQEILATTTDNAWGDVVIIRTYYKEMHKSVIAWMPLPESYKTDRKVKEDE